MQQLWCDMDDVQQGKGGTLMSFFSNQLGVNQKLKFWHCEMRQFPKLNERASHETTAAANASGDWDSGYSYPYEGFPSGQADTYLREDPLSPTNQGIPFRIIHTRPISNDRAKMAALSFIDQDDFLRDIFDWGTSKETGQWDGAALLGIEYTKRLPTKSAILDDAKSTWFVWNNGDAINPKTFDVQKHGITVISESAIRTWNWYLKSRDYALLSFDRIEEISDKFRGEPWSTPTCLKTFRLDWPVMRNIEESSEITGLSPTKTIEDLVTNHLGEITRKKVMAKLEKDCDRSLTDPEWQYDGIDGEILWDSAEKKWKNYCLAVSPIGQEVVWKLDFSEEPDVTEDGIKPPAEIIGKMKSADLKLDKLLEAIQGIQSEGSTDPKGGHRVSKSNEDIDVLRISPAPSDSLRRMQNIQMAMADPIQFAEATPAIYERTTGKLKGAAVSDDFRTIQFVGYAKTVTKHDTTFEVIAEIACNYMKEHFSGMVPPHGGNEWVTPAMLIWATGSDICTKNTEIICPDPRTISVEIRKSLETK